MSLEKPRKIPQEPEMINTIKTMSLLALATFTGLSLSSVAQAEYDYEDNYHALYGYEDELQQCVELLRPSVETEQADRITYQVQEIDLHGPWYKFEIAATTYLADGQKIVDGFRVACKSNRWIEQARLIERRNSPAVDRVLVVRETGELLIDNALAVNSPR
jgi:lysyl-tRNA synthetase class II